MNLIHINSYKEAVKTFHSEITWYKLYGSGHQAQKTNDVIKALRSSGLCLADLPSDFEEFKLIFSDIYSIHAVLDRLNKGGIAPAMNALSIATQKMVVRELMKKSKQDDQKIETLNNLLIDLILINNEYKRQIHQ